MKRFLLILPLFLMGFMPIRAQQAPDIWFNSLVAHWTNYATPEYLKFLHDARPEVAQVGFYGLTFYSLADSEQWNGYPSHLPIKGSTECRQWFNDLNRNIHQDDTKVVGHFNMTYIFGDPDKNTGFFHWYNDLWDEKEFGPKPCSDPKTMLSVKADGQLISSRPARVKQMPEYWGCLNNPQWRAVLKAMVTVAIKNGVDGLIANYFYRKDCMCTYCREGFRHYLATHYTADELRTKMGIDNLRTHVFTEIPSWHNPATTTPYRMAALTWTQIALKQAFDEVLHTHGRAIKPDFMTAQWDHLGNFGQIAGDERCCLPGDLWGKEETYLWYSSGASFCYTDLANDWLGDGTLQLRYIKGAFGKQTFLLGKYEPTRMRVSIAEGVANGGAGMGFYANYTDPVGYRAFVDYFGFLRKYREYYHGAVPAGELLLLYPRSAVHAGDITPVARFRTLGNFLVRQHLAFDVLPDDLLTTERLNRYRAVAYCDENALAPEAKYALTQFTGPKLLQTTAELPADASMWKQTMLSAITVMDGSPTVVLSLMAQPKTDRLLVHLVNYNRTEPAKPRSPGKGPQDEKPIAVENQVVHLQLPHGKRVSDITILSPDPETPAVNATFVQHDDTVTFTVPTVLVYTVAVVRYR